MNARRALLGPILAGTFAAMACTGGEPSPAPLDTATETCRSCRMPVSDPRLAAQLSAPGEEAVFFDDIGCLRDFLKQNRVPPAAFAYVVDHRTASWVRAAEATYSRCPSLETPMGSHLIAHSSPESRDADATAGRCAGVSPEEVFGSPPPSGK